MRKLLFSTVVLAGLAGQALAADLPSTKAPPPVYTPPPPIFSWTGAYVGVYGGGVFSSANVYDGAPGANYNQSPTGGTVGGLVGYNYQVNPNFVVGIEGEGGWQGFSSTDNYTAWWGNPISQNVNSDYVARIRGRLGYAVNNALFFVAGGASFSDLKVSMNDPTAGFSDGISRDISGWNIGAGVDYALTPNWVGRFEYIYDGYGSQTYAFANLPDQHFDNLSVRPNESTVRAALIYKFGAPETVGAKY